ncbi:MAG TPA: acyl-CoA dehydrogenase family protein [Oligoflexus sp.]|uniref:acyl-CoA dehydrogenase family protein n=1 Tax=Oligoflexus sp. TaxID=1971216 RepID=UPI002D6A21B7|nr:acyl-CoA dehydrogenase family protein [Oligoflexus sp.]HYX34390.1 acyl-CoA dehydrogenase family protein [Oligoflexus sp.]
MHYLEAVKTTRDEIISRNVQKTDQEASFPKEAITAFGKNGILGLMSDASLGGQGLGLDEAAAVIESIAEVCPSTAMVLMMHYSATAVIEKYGPVELRTEIARGHHLSTLAWSEVSSRSHFWAPSGTAEKVGDGFILNGNKTMVTSASQADSFIWSSKPAEGEAASSLWLVKKYQEGLSSPAAFDGLGLRGNDSAPMQARQMKLSSDSLLGADGEGFDIMINTVLPVFCVLNASASIGIMDGALALAIQHVSAQKFEHLNSSLAELPTIRAYLAKARIQADMTRTLRNDTLSAIKENRADAMLRVMEVKAAAGESAMSVTDICMRVCGGAAFRKDLGLEKLFRDARSSSIMAPTSDVLYDFIGKAICNMPVFG